MPFVDASLHCFYAFCSYYLFLSVYQISNNRTERTEADEGIKGFFIFSGPRGFRQKNLQKMDSMQLEVGFGGIRFPHVKGSDSLSFRDFLISPIIFVYNLDAGPRAACRYRFLKMFKIHRHLATKKIL